MLSLKAHRTFIRMTACVLKIYFRLLNRRLFASGRSWRPSELWPFRHISFGSAQKRIPESVQIDPLGYERGLILRFEPNFERWFVVDKFVLLVYTRREGVSAPRFIHFGQRCIQNFKRVILIVLDVYQTVLHHLALQVRFRDNIRFTDFSGELI